MSETQLTYLLGGGKVVLILVVGVVLLKVLHRAIRKITEHAAKHDRQHFNHKPGAAARHAQRATAIGSVLDSAATIFVVGVTALLVLGELGVQLGPVLASAGVLSVALGFGAQELVRDFMCGVAMIVEDQYGVGDVISLGAADGEGILVTGTVESVALRITRIRDFDDVVWYVRNGEVVRVGNRTQGEPKS